MDFHIKVTSAPGLESILASEIRELGLLPLAEGFGAVELKADWEAVAKILLHCRTGSRVLLRIAEFASRHEAMLYDQVRRIDWPRWFSVDQTFSIRVVGDFSGFNMARTFAPLKIKDAICDEFRKRTDERPSVDRNDSDAPIVAFFRKGRCELSLDLTGYPLYRRGYRAESGKAPIKEHRAAALLRFLGYDGGRPFLDPFCGSGTLAIEAALIASGCPPGSFRDPMSFPASRVSMEAQETIRNAWSEARSRTTSEPAYKIVGSDIDEEAIRTARSNAARAGVEDWIDFQIADSRMIEAPDTDIVSNPPYGERVSDVSDAIQLLGEFTDRVKSHCGGARMALVLPHGPVSKGVNLKADQKLPVMSAPLELRFMKFSIFKKR